MNLYDLVDPDQLQEAIDQKLINVRVNKDGDRIYNYSDLALFTPGAWDNPAVRVCRGLIVTEEDEILARPWAKFFNYGQPEAGELDLDAPVEVTDKVDGSLGIIYLNADGERCVATRGSFESDQAIHATSLLRKEGYIRDRSPLSDVTPLVEIVYPENRIVCDYGDADHLVLLGAVTDAGDYLGPREAAELFSWTGPVTQTFEYATLREALLAPPRPGAEGMCVRFLNENRIVKVKQEDYLRLHRIMFGMSEKVVWRHLAVHAVKDHITKPQHWGSFLGADSDEAEKEISLGEEWLEQSLYRDDFPDEVISWYEKTKERIRWDRARLYAEAVSLVEDVHALPPKEQHTAVKHHPMVTEILYAARKGDFVGLHVRSWREVKPTRNNTIFARSEDVA